MVGYLLEIQDLQSLDEVVHALDVSREVFNGSCMPIQATCHVENNKTASVLLLCTELTATPEQIQHYAKVLGDALPTATVEATEIPKKKQKWYCTWAQAVGAFASLFPE